jgi:hypothetical protein
MRSHRLVALSLGLLSAACDDPQAAPTPSTAETAASAPTPPPPTSVPPKPEPPAEAKEARAIVARFAEKLKKELTAGLEKGGPDAIEICHTRAPEIAGELAANGWTVGRTSRKLRNPENAPDRWERGILEELDARQKAGADPASLERWQIAETKEGRTFRYMKAIPTAPMCLTCHGHPTGEIAAALVRLYPNDAARGHAPGDLRGAFTLEKKL